MFVLDSLKDLMKWVLRLVVIIPIMIKILWWTITGGLSNLLTITSSETILSEKISAILEIYYYNTITPVVSLEKINSDLIVSLLETFFGIIPGYVTVPNVTDIIPVTIFFIMGYVIFLILRTLVKSKVLQSFIMVLIIVTTVFCGYSMWKEWSWRKYVEYNEQRGVGYDKTVEQVVSTNVVYEKYEPLKNLLYLSVFATSFILGETILKLFGIIKQNESNRYAYEKLKSE